MTSEIKCGIMKVSGAANAQIQKKGLFSNKTEFIAKVAAKAGVEKKAAAALVDAALEVVTDAVKAHEPISIVGFGTLSIAHREERTGKNPKTGETLKIPARSVPVFKPGSTLKEAANSK